MSQHGEFIWCDLSSYRPDRTRPFYAGLFGWNVPDDPYAIATDGPAPVAAIFEMPQTFQNMGMPSFWMTYIRVDDVAHAVETAKANGGKVEVGPIPYEGGGDIALIRDPLGAGFTVYAGDALEGGGNRLGHTLMVSDATVVMPFYAALFGWSFGKVTAGVRPIVTDGQTIGHLHEIPDPAIRGKEEFWAVLFSAPAESLTRLSGLGGHIEAEVSLPEGQARLVRDPDKAAFFVVEGAGPANTGSPTERRPWAAWVGLALIGLAVATGWGWITAVFFAVWIAMGLRDGATFLFEMISRDRQPVLYWTVLATFAALGVLSLFYPGL